MKRQALAAEARCAAASMRGRTASTRLVIARSQSAARIATPVNRRSRGRLRPIHAVPTIRVQRDRDAARRCARALAADEQRHRLAALDRSARSASTSSTETAAAPPRARRPDRGRRGRSRRPGGSAKTLSARAARRRVSRTHSRRVQVDAARGRRRRIERVARVDQRDGFAALRRRRERLRRHRRSAARRRRR